MLKAEFRPLMSASEILVSIQAAFMFFVIFTLSEENLTLGGYICLAFITSFVTVASYKKINSKSLLHIIITIFLPHFKINRN